jgi:predicted ATPase
MTPPVRLQKLRIENFRGITDLTLELAPTGATVLVGANGMGKTSVLEAVLLALGNRDNGRDENLVRFGAKDYRITPIFDGCQTWGHISREDELTTAGSVGEFEYFSARRALTEQVRLDDLKHKLISAYYRSLRERRPSPQFEEIQEFLRPFLVGQRTLDVFPTSNNPGSGDSVILRDGPIPDDVTSLTQARFLARMRSDLPNMVPLEALSSGELSLFAFIAPLVFRDFPLDLLVIDEPEMHLHPAWQQLLISSLEKLLPTAQILVATHSPHILTTVRNDQIRVLSADGRVTIPDVQTQGWDSGDVLARVMGAHERPQNGPARLVSDYFAQVAEGTDGTPEGEALLTQIRNHYGISHPLVLECEAAARFAAFRRRNPPKGAPTSSQGS